MATVNDILRATVTGVTIDNQVFNLVHHYLITSGTESDYDAIADAIVGVFHTAYDDLEAHLSDEVLSGELELSEWDFTNHEWDGKVTVTNASIVGDAITDPLPGGNSIVLRFITDSLRRQGRKFIPGLVEADALGNDISAPILVDAATLAGWLNNDIIGGAATLRPCVFNDTPASPHYETNSPFTATAFVNTTVGYQRRRQPGDGI